MYWEANKPKHGDAGPDSATASIPSSPLQERPRRTHNRKRSASDGTSLFQPEHKLSPYHPAWSLTSLLDRFGPLIFPIHRAALLRQRILISCHAPVHEICNFGRHTDISLTPCSITQQGKRYSVTKANPIQYIIFPSYPISPFLSQMLYLLRHRLSDLGHCSRLACTIFHS